MHRDCNFALGTFEPDWYDRPFVLPFFFFVSCYNAYISVHVVCIKVTRHMR